jgi:hypothetical protein
VGHEGKVRGEGRRRQPTLGGARLRGLASSEPALSPRNSPSTAG